MPSLDDLAPLDVTKMLLIGDTGTGKTGSLVSLARAGYNLRIIDLDNGMDIIRNLLRGDPAAKNVIYETFTERMKQENAILKPVDATVWPKVMRTLDKWEFPEREMNGRKIPAYSLGPIASWTPQDVLVIDSLTLLGKAAENYHLKLNQRLGTIPKVSDWLGIQAFVRNLLATLYSTQINCNIVVVSHINYIYEEEKDEKGWVKSRDLVKAYPSAPGAKLPPEVGRYFNTMLEVVSRGSSRVISTQPSSSLQLKNSNPLNVKKEYKIENGLAEFFADVRK